MGSGGDATGNGGAIGSGGAGGADGGSSFNFNQCGVAAPLPANPGQCTVVTSPTITNFDDYSGGNAGNYTYYINGRPPAAGAVLGAVQHIGDGSDANGGTSVISTQMVTGREGTGYALEFSDTNAGHWGGLLSLYFPSTGPGCLDARTYTGVEFWIKGSSPSGRFGVSLNMLDTVPTSSGGLCSSASSSDCKSASLEFVLPSDAQTWTKVQVPWNAMTPGLGSQAACIPVTGQNITQLVIQPFMNYPPPNYTFAPGPYQIAVDDLAFYVDPGAGQGSLTGGSSTCGISPTLHWSASAPLISPVSDATHDLAAVKDPSIVYFNNRWHVYASSVSKAGAYSTVYTSFTDFTEASTAPLYYMDQTLGFNGYTAAPELFYFTPQNKWYLVFQSGPPMYSTADDPGDPTKWTPPAPFFSATPSIITQNGGGWLDFWVICDAASCHLFFSDNHGRWYSSKTSIDQFPKGFAEPVVVMQDANAGRMFEASNVYKMNGTGQYLALIESFDQTSNNHRYYRSWVSNSLDGPWLPWQASGSYPFAGPSNVTFSGTAWTIDISHGEMVRGGYDETLAIDPCNMRYLFQGADPNANTGGDYNKIPWRLGLLTQTQ
jgi:endo-1,4-beta-xylanase